MNWLESCLARIPSARVTVFGDFCVDAYWLLDTGEQEISVETNLHVRRVRQQRYSLGGAGNVVANVADIGAGSVEAVGLVGDDLFGPQLLKLLAEKKTKATGMIVARGWQTAVYSKPMLGDEELSRIDFGAFNEIDAATIAALAAKLDEAASRSNIVIVNQQLPGGVTTAAMIEAINAIIAKHPATKFIVDARHRAHLFRGAILKMNAHEAAALIGRPVSLNQKISTDDARAIAKSLHEQTGQVVFVTRGEAGMLIADRHGVAEEPGVQVIGPVDTVGAGDTVVSALAAALGSGSDAATAARLANIAASITVKKLKTTGTATPAEIRAVGPRPDLLYHTDLAADPRTARYAAASRIEIVRQVPATPIRCAIFDHDGTITTLRQGWEHIMEPVMIEAVHGPRPPEGELLEQIRQRVRQLIDHTTGVQTLVQMQGLVELVREFNLVAAEHMLDEHGYKARYKAALDKLVEDRMGQLRRGEREWHSILVPGAREFIADLHRHGIKLYLCSGSDRDDVIADCKALEIDRYFEGRIYGAIGDVKVEAKRMILDQIMNEIAPGSGSSDRLGVVTFGDGPVEMRETRKRGGIAVGIASDETELGELSLEKRRRLIRAGADLITPDYREAEALRRLLHIP
jgi:rfaE bifunctional protein kinase chain/domain